MKELETVVQDEKNKWILITGILQVLACVIMNKFDISNPNIILFVILSAVLVQFGYGAGMLCGFITYIYSMYFFSTDHSFFYFDASNRDKIMVVIFGIIANILIVGSLKARMEKSNKERIHQLEVATTLNKCAVELSADRDIHTAIYNLLGIINQYFQADRSYIFDIDHEKQIVINTYEYTAEGVTRQIDNLQSVPLSVIAVWMDKFENGQVYYIADAEQEKGYPTYEMLVEQNIKRLLTVPLKKNGKVTGFIGVDNPKVHFDDATLLLSLQYFIVNSQSSQRQQERLQFLSFRDMLTGLYNRNKYMKVLETFEKYPVCDTGVAYIDLNGLKQINDNLGHEAGDRLLCDAAKEILRTFPENSYRKTKKPIHRSGQALVSYQFRGEKPLVAFLHLSEALAAVNRTVLTGTERNLAGLAAVGAYSVKHLSLGAGIVLAGISALSASLRLVLEALLCIELLLTSGEYELLAALFAYQCLVCVHSFYLS